MNNGDKLYLNPNLLMCLGVTLMVVMGATSISPALPQVMDALGVSAGAIGLVITVFTIPGVVLTLAAGVLADRYGRKRLLVPSLVLFSISGALCGLANDYQSLLALRFTQGIGAAALGALNITILGDLFDGPKRATALGINAAVLVFGIATYPILGGLLATFGWRYPFFLPILALPLAILIHFRMTNPEPKTKQPLGQYFRGTLKYLKEVRIIIVLLSTLVAFILIYGVYLTYLPVHLGKDLGVSPLTISLMLGLSALFTGIMSSQLGRLTSRFKETTLMTTAFIFYAVGIGGMVLASDVWSFAPPVMLFGMGEGLSMPVVQLLLINIAPMEHRAGFISLNGFILRLGQTIGPLFMAFFYSLGGAKLVFAAGSGLSLCMFLLFILVLRGSSRKS